jgi:hypothetical protein
VNCHLAAHQSHVSERNKDVSQILKEANFPKLLRKNHWESGGDGSMIMVRNSWLQIRIMNMSFSVEI